MISTIKHPERIVCLTEESTETLYLLGEQHRIVGISGFTVRPAIARKEKPKVSAFLSAKTDKILDLKPDLVIGFSDLQADIAAELIRRGLNVLVFNQRSIDEIRNMILTLSSIVGAESKGRELLATYAADQGCRDGKTANRLLRRVGRPVNFEYPMGVGSGSGCRRSRLFSGTIKREPGQEPHHRRPQ